MMARPASTARRAAARVSATVSFASEAAYTALEFEQMDVLELSAAFDAGNDGATIPNREASRLISASMNTHPAGRP